MVACGNRYGICVFGEKGTELMRLGFHYHVPAINQDGSIYMPGYMGRFIDSLAVNCEQVVCFLHTPTSGDVDRMDYRISSGNVVLISIGPALSVVERELRSRTYTACLRSAEFDLDILLLRGPSPLLPAMAAVSPFPTALLLVGDYLSGLDYAPQPRWRKEAIRMWVYWNKWGQNRAMRHSLTFVNSRVLYDDLKEKVPLLYETRTTTLSRGDFLIRSDTCRSDICRLLYVGRITRPKGLLELVEAVALLAERGEHVVLDLVGWIEPGDPVLDMIKKLAQERNISKKICFWGFQPVGPALSKFYESADIFIIASFAEGFPRAIWEAMAHSVPVVATTVGSIPAFVEDAAELVPPGQASALAESISKLIHDPSLRRKLISRGLELARGNTLEIQAEEMTSIMKDWIKATQT